MKNLKSIIALLVLTVFSVNVWGSTYTKVTSVTDVTDGEYLIVYEVSTTAGRAFNGVDAANEYVECTISSGTITANDLAAYEVTIAAMTGGYSLQLSASLGTDNKSKYIYGKSGSNSIEYGTTAVANEITIANGAATILSNSTSLRYNSASGNDRFRYYKTSTTGNTYILPALYKKEADCTPAGIDLSITSANTVKTGKTISLTSTGGNGGTVKWSVTNLTGTATINGNVLTAGNEGTVTVKAHQELNGTTCETDAEQTVTISAITFTDYITECSGDPEIGVNLDAVEGLGYVYGSAASESIVKDFTVVGGNLSQKVSVTAPIGFEVKSEGAFADKVELTPSAEGLINQKISVRLSSGKTVNADGYTGNVTIHSAEIAEDKTVALSAKVTPAQLAPPEVTATSGVHQITLSWNEVPNASSYQLVWNNGTPETVTSPVVKDKLTGGQSYSYSLVAVGTGNYSNSSADEGNATAGKETYTVNFYVNGNATPKSIQEGEKVIEYAPTPEAFDDDFQTFVGWTTSAINGIAENEPTLITDETVTGEANYYAVFSDTKLSNTYTFYDGTTVPDGNYLIAGYAEDWNKNGYDYLMKNELTGDYYIAVDQQSGSNDSYTNPAAANIWQLTTTNNGTTIYNASAKKYIEMYANGTHRNLRLSENPSYFTVALNDKAVCTILSKSYSGYYVAFVSGTFDEFAAKQAADIDYNTYLFKQDVETTGYITSCGEVGKTRISYNANTTAAYTGTLPDYVDQTNGQAYTISTNQLSRTGYTFVGWNTNADATEKMTTIPAADITGTPIILYAIWSANSYDIVFNGNGADGGTTMDNQPITFDASANLNQNTYTRTGHTFQGWATTEGGQVVYADKASYTMTSTGATLYAVWKPNQHKITYVLGEGGSGCGNISAQDYGTTVTLCSSASKAYHTFAGWTSEDVTIVDNQFTMPDKDVTITATWTEFEKYTVTFKNNGEPIADLSRQVYAGDGIGKVLGVETPLPTLASTDAKDWWSTTFVGWTVEDWDGKKAEYAGLVKTNTLATDGMVLNAVWAKETEGTGYTNNYQKITSTSDLTSGDYIFMAYEDYYSTDYYWALDKTTYQTNFLTATSVKDKLSDNKEQILNNTDNDIVWTIAFKNNDNSKISIKNGNNYLNMIQYSGHRNLKCSSTSDYFTYSVNNGLWKFVSENQSGYKVYYNADYTEYGTIEEDASVEGQLYLYKRIHDIAYSDYITKSTTAPDLVVSPTALSNFSTIATAGPSTAQSFTIQGGNLKGDVTASVGENSDYEISASQESGYAKKITFTPNNKRVSATVYVRLANHTENTAIASASGTVTVATEDAVSQLVALSGKVDAKTLNSISIETAPKTTYTIGEKFNPEGLVITATYNSGNETVSYADHESEFSFSPVLDAELTASDGSVSVTWDGKSTSVTLTLNCSVAWKVNGADWAEGTPTTSVVLNGKLTKLPDDPSEEACDGKVFRGWTSATSVNADGAGITYAEANKTTISANTTFNAVFATASEGGEPETLLSEDFTSIDKGDNTTTGGSGTAWGGNDNFPSSGNSTAYQAGGAVKLGGGSSTGKIKSKSLTVAKGDEITVNFDVKGWSSVEGDIKVSVTGCDAQTITYTNKMADGFESKSATFTATTTEITVTLETTVKRAFLDNIEIISKPGIQYSDYTIACTPTYAVNFFINSGDAEPYATQKVEEGSKATAPETEPSKAGATFAGWFTANDEALADKTITEATDFIAKWNYTAPTITKQPTGGEYSIDASVNLVVEVEAIEGVSFTYQWQRLNGSIYEDIAGATNSYYTAPTNQESQNTYRCVVTNGDASTPSNGAQITVRPASYCAMPTIRIDELGEATAFIREATVTMECGNEGATIYYTLDGSDPKAVGANPETYTVPFKIDATKTIEAYATATDLEPSSVQTKIFTKATLQSIAVKTAPTKTEYTALETFIPAGLAITAAYNYELSEDVAYAGHEDKFGFSPDLETKLNVGNDKVTITWGGKETEQEITVNCLAIAAPSPSQVGDKQFTEVTIEWADVANADHYELSWEGGEAEIVTSPYKKEGLTYSKTYHYTLTAIGKTNYCDATTEDQEAKTKNRVLIGIDDTKPIICTHGNYFAGQTIKNTDFTVTLLYNNGDTEDGTPNYIGLSEPVESTKETDALTAGQEGALTVYLKSASKTVSTTVTVANPSVTFNVPSGTEVPAAIHRGDKYPSMQDITDCGDNEYDYTFVGWTENTVDAETTTEPENIITAGTTCEITANQVVYALYKRTVPAYRYKKIDAASTNNIVNGSYVIVHNNGYYVAATTSDSYPKAVAVTIEDDTIKDVVAAMKWNIEVGNTGLLTITNADDKYLRGKSNDTEIRVDATLDTWTAAVQNSNSKKYFTFQSTKCNASKRYMSINGTTDYRDYSEPSVATKIFSLYRYQEDVTTSAQYFITTPNCAKRVPVSLELDITNVQQEFYVNDVFNSDNLVVTAHFDNEDVEDVSASEFTSVTAPDMTTATEEATVTVSYIENETTVSKTYTVLIKERVASVVTLVSVGKESTLSGTHYTGEQVNLPTEPSLTVKGYEFMGWSTNEIETPSSCPATGFYTGGASFDLTQPAYTFYAVYALGAGSASDNDKFGLSIVTDPAGLVDGGLYMFTIANTSNTLAATTVSNSAIQTVTNFKTEQLQGNESYIWKLSASDDNTFKMQMSDGEYLGTSSTSMNKTGHKWQFTYGSNSESGWRIQDTENSSRFWGLTETSSTTIKAYSPSDNNNWGKYPHVFTIYRLMGGYTTAPTLVVDGTDITEIPEDFNGNVIVENVGDVTLSAATTWKNLTIKNGAKVTTNAALSIKDLLIETKMGAGTGKTNSPNMKGA
ncbi:MAG: InlB B-repeat-containing protein, partial [Bacteroidaceae bacterium]|nr:InlB B-repeat-containing protein [Bacteroidaceae bacterium]